MSRSSENGKVTRDILRKGIKELSLGLESHIRLTCRTYKEAKKTLQYAYDWSYADSGEREMIKYLMKKFEREHEDVEMFKPGKCACKDSLEFEDIEMVKPEKDTCEDSFEF